jgi:cytochrome c oxidase assembly protein subunit 11
VRTALALATVVVAMIGASYAAVPLYNLFCQVTGYGGTTSVAAGDSGEVVDRSVTVAFDANTAPDMPWEFRPKQRSVTLKLGETGLAFYEAYNPTDEAIAGQAGFNVVPFEIGRFFDKIACFCFDLQVLQPGERVDMPVSFYVDPEMLGDLEARGVTHITLSYTMFRTDLPEEESRKEASLRAFGTRVAAAAGDVRPKIEQ